MTKHSSPEVTPEPEEQPVDPGPGPGPAPEPSPRRGRPTVIDPDAVMVVCLELWTARGFARTGWREIAEATGVSIRTLIRHFGSRTGIFWAGVPASIARLRTELEAADPEQDIADVLRTAVLTSMAGDSDPLSSRWSQLIDQEPELAAAAHEVYGPWRAVLAEYISRRLPDAPAAIPPALAAAYQAASHAALIGWVSTGEEDGPSRAVDEALRWLGSYALGRPGGVNHPAGA